MLSALPRNFFFFFNDTATTEIYTLSLHDALPISTLPSGRSPGRSSCAPVSRRLALKSAAVKASPSSKFANLSIYGPPRHPDRSEEHTSELQSRQYLVCRLLLEEKQSDEPGVSHALSTPAQLFFFF